MKFRVIFLHGPFMEKQVMNDGNMRTFFHATQELAFPGRLEVVQALILVGTHYSLIPMPVVC